MNLGLNLGLGTVRAGGGVVTGLSLTATKVGVDEAPQGVHFVATALGVSDQADVVVWWDFGDDYQFRYLPADTKANDRQSGTAIGRVAAHVYRSAGTYTATATAYQFVNGSIVSRSQIVEVVIAASDPAITERIAISKTGSFTGAPAGSTQVDWSGGVPSSYTFAKNKAYYFQAGQTFDLTGGTSLTWASSGGSVLITKYGAGANPIINVQQGSDGLNINGNRCGQVTVSEVDFVGGFDVNNSPEWENTGIYPTPPAEPGEGISFALGLANTALKPQCLVFGCRISGFGIGFYPTANAVPTTGEPSANMLVDSEITNWFNFGALCGSIAPSISGYVGNYIHQKVGTQQLPQQQSLADRGAWNAAGRLNTARHGPMRVEDANNSVVNKSVLYSYRSGWSESPVAGVASIQPALRFQTNPVSSAQMLGTASQNDTIGGYYVCTTMDAGGVVGDSDPLYAAVEFNYVASDAGRTEAFFGTSKPGMHTRGNICHWPSSETVQFSATRRLVAEQGAIEDTANATAYFYGNTVVVDGSTPGDVWSSITGLDGNRVPFIYENNIIQMNGTFDSGGSTSLFQTNYNPIEADFPFLPKFGSIAYGGYAAGKLPALTQSGAARTAPFSLGAGEESDEPVVTVAINETEIFGGAVLGTNVTETGTIVFAGTPPLSGGAISYNWLVNGVQQSDSYVVAATDVVRARASFTHATGSQVVLSAPITVQAGAIAAPVLTGSPTLLASWDFNNPSTVTEVSGAVSAVAGSDGTSVTLSQANASQRPSRVTVGSYKVARFARASSQFLQVANSLGNPSAMTLVLVVKSNTTTVGQTFYALDVANRAGGSTRRRVAIYANLDAAGVANNGWTGQKANSTANSMGKENAVVNTNTRLAIVTAASGSTPASLYMDGVATPVSGASVTPETTYTHVTMGAGAISNAESLFASADVYRALIYSGALNATQLEEIAVWAATNYGTPNNP